VRVLVSRIRIVCGVLAALASGARAEIPAEQVTVGKLPPATAYRLYLADVAIPHIVDGKLLILDGAALKVQGVVSTGLAGLTTLSPDRAELYVATTYFPRLNRGERHDQLDVYDASTLKLKAEIPIPPKHAQALPYRGYLRASADGRFVFVQNATPATSVSVVDRAANKFVAEIPTPGCWSIFTPKSTASANRFSTLCGDGTMLTVTLDDQGIALSKRKSAKFFDPDADPLFIVGERSGDRYVFISFKGFVHTLDVAGEEAVVGARWPTLTDAQAKRGWRPGGYQPLALHEKSGTLYVGMHRKGAEGSHKNPADEIWVFDLASGKRLARTNGRGATSLAVSQGDQPRLFAFEGGKMAMHAFAALPSKGKIRLLASGGPFGETPTQMDVQ
jgi:methylamine dehydrogenase heavy chain